MIISRTAYSIGYGRDRWKFAAGLSKDEREMVKKGLPVFYIDNRLSGGNHGHLLRVALYRQGRYYRRVATKEECEQFENAFDI